QSAAASAFFIAGFPSPVTSGTAGSFAVTAKDAYGNMVTGYSGTVHLSSSDPQAVLPADATLSNGTGVFGATLKTAGYQSITARGALTRPVASRLGSIPPVTVTIQTDPATMTRQMLVIDGTANGDSIVLGTGANVGVTLSFNGTALGNVLPTNGSPFAVVVVFGEGGNDTLDTRGLTVSSVLEGGTGSDTLSGGSGRNLLIGGLGADTLVAGSGGDIL